VYSALETFLDDSDHSVLVLR